MPKRLLALIFVFAATSAAAVDHLDPIALHAAAIEALRADDLRTAQILLARAARLAPGDPRIARAREALRKRRAGEAVELDPPAPPAAKPSQEAASPGAIAPEPPPLWPTR